MPEVKEKAVTSRFAKPVTKAGWDIGGRAATAAHVYNGLVEERRSEAAAHCPAFVSVKLKAVRLTADGYQLVDRGEVSAIPSYANQRPSLRWRKMFGGELLDSLATGEVDGAWGKAPEMECWEALLSLCEAELPTGDALKRLNEAVAHLLLVRAGLNPATVELPHIG